MSYDTTKHFADMLTSPPTLCEEGVAAADGLNVSAKLRRVRIVLPLGDWIAVDSWTDPWSRKTGPARSRPVVFVYFDDRGGGMPPEERFTLCLDHETETELIGAAFGAPLGRQLVGDEIGKALGA